MNDLVISGGNSGRVMSSRAIASLTDKEHGHVMRDIRVMCEALKIDQSAYGSIYRDTYNREQQEFMLDRELTLTLVSGYDIPLRHRVVRRLAELEAKDNLPAPVLAIPDFSNPAAAARAWAEQYEARQHAESTKAEIGSRREATAMNTASVAVKKAQRLEIELDKSKDYATVKRMERLYHGQPFNWRALKGAASEMNLPAIDVFDQNYGTVKAYHRDVWHEVYALAIEGDA